MNELLTERSGGISRVQFNRPAALYTGLANLLNEADTAFTVPIDAYRRGVTNGNLGTRPCPDDPGGNRLRYPSDLVRP
jgi:hypothetical protein